MATILIVDDDKALAARVGKTLQGVGHRCLLSETGEQALQCLTQEDVDLIVLDIMLPGISGFEVCRRIHSDTAMYSLPILFLSAMNDEEEVQHGLAQGADDYMVKPLREQELVRRVDQLLRNAQGASLNDSAAAMPGPRGVKLETQKALSLKTPFALVNIEPLHLADYVRAQGAEGRQQVVSSLANLVCGASQMLTSKEVWHRFGHMGGGHFVFLTPPKDADALAQTLCDLWRESVKTFKGVSHPGWLQLLVCYVCHSPENLESTRGLFDTLTRLRTKAVEEKAVGVYGDRRNG